MTILFMILSGLFLYSFFLLTFLILVTPVVHILSSEFVKTYFDATQYKVIQYSECVFNFFYSADMWNSSMAYILNLAVALVGMGFGALILFLIVTPGLNLVFPFHIPLTTKGIDIAWSSVGAHGDSAWPSMILVALQFSVGFIIAGYAMVLLKGYDLHFALKVLIYIAILWIWSFLLWATTLGGIKANTKSNASQNSKISKIQV